MSDDFVLSSRHYKDLLQQLKDAEAYGKNADKELAQVRADLYETEKRLRKADELLEGVGYRKCDVAACNCGGYHQQREEPEV